MILDVYISGIIIFIMCCWLFDEFNSHRWVEAVLWPITLITGAARRLIRKIKQ